MKPAPFVYHDPRSVAETIALLAEHGDEAKVLAGGQSLVPLMALRLARPARLVDINHVADLAHRADSDGALSIGALTRQEDLAGDVPLVGAHRLLARALRHVGHAAVRVRGTVGGSLAHADPAAELPAAALALGATMVLQGPGGEREVPAGEFFHGVFTTAVEPDELLTAVRVPAWPARSGSAFHEVARRRGDFAQVGVAVAVALGADGTVERTGVAVAGVAGTPVVATPVVDGLRGRVPEPELVGQLAAQFAAALDPPADLHGSPAYRRQLVRHLLPAAVAEAVREAA